MRLYSQPRIRFIKRFFYSFSSPNFYIQIVKEPLSKAIQYGILLTAIISIITSIFLSFELRNTYANIHDFISHPSFPNITFQNYETSPILIRFDTIGFLSFNKDEFLFLLKYSEYFSHLLLFLFYFIQLCLQYFFKSFILYFMSAWFFSGLKISRFELRGKQIFSIILYAMSLATIIQELFYLMRPSNQYILAMFIVVFYLMTMKITRNGMTAILLDRIGKSELQDTDDFFS